jgi:hypothetical protein
MTIKTVLSALLITVGAMQVAAAEGFDQISQSELAAEISRLGHFVGTESRPRRHEASVENCILQTDVWEQNAEGPETLWTVFRLDLRGLTIPEPDEKTGLRTLFADMGGKASVTIMPIEVIEPFELRHEKAAIRAKSEKHRVEKAAPRHGVPYVYEYRQSGFIVFQGATKPDQFENLFNALLAFKTRFCATVS